jgi:hypothetical protein
MQSQQFGHLILRWNPSGQVAHLTIEHLFAAIAGVAKVNARAPTATMSSNALAKSFRMTLPPPFMSSTILDVGTASV